MVTDHTETQLLRRICLQPEDDLAKLVLADWWEENAETAPCPVCAGSGKLGHVHRHGLRGPGYYPCDGCRATGSFSDGRMERAEFVRLQLELASLPDCQFKYFPDDKRCDQTARPYSISCRSCELRRREREMIRHHWTQWIDGVPQPLACMNIKKGPLGPSDDHTQFTFARGFVSSVACPAVVWQSHSVAIVASQPIERVTLTDRRPWTIGGSDRVDWFRADCVGLGSPDGVPSEWWEYLKNPKAKVLLYCSAIEAHADLSRAALAWARSLAFGPDAPPQMDAGPQGAVA